MARAPHNDAWVAAVTVIGIALSEALRRKFTGANAPAWALHSWSCRHIRPPIPPGVASFSTWTFLSRREGQPELPGSLRPAASQGCVRKEWRKWFEFDKGVVGEGTPCQFCLRNLKTRGAMWIRP